MLTFFVYLFKALFSATLTLCTWYTDTREMLLLYHLQNTSNYHRNINVMYTMLENFSYLNFKKRLSVVWVQRKGQLLIEVFIIKQILNVTTSPSPFSA